MKITDNIRNQFGKWLKYFQPFIESEAFDNIFYQIKQRAKLGTIMPAAGETFRCFRDTDPDNLKVIFCSFAPYHTKIDGTIVADGLAFSCSHTGKKYGCQPSLHIIYNAIEQTYCGGFNLNMQMEPDLQYWADQGILLYNTGLTVEENKAGSMNDIWKPFDEFFWKEVVNKYFRGLPIVFFGQVAAKSEKYLTPMLHYPHIVEHPAALAHRGSGEWKYNDIFKKIDTILWDNNKEKINWYKESKTLEAPPW